MTVRYGSARRRGRHSDIVSTLATLLLTLTFMLVVFAVGLLLLRSALR
ncbi:MAG TPA: hypothetical protein VH373_01410 [Jatrophihabitantaceae bacterium]|jgi:hypothetical protein